MDVTASGMVGYLVAAIGAIGGLGTAAFALVDATKAFKGGVSNFGYGFIEAALRPFSAPLDAAIGASAWREAVYAHWINGRPRDEQKAIVKALIRLGLSPKTAGDLAAAGHVDPTALTDVARKLESGAALVEADINVLGRLDASVEAQLDAAFDRADQRYRNASKVFAGVAAIVLALAANLALRSGPQAVTVIGYGHAVIVGLLAVPLAPIAKDLASSLSTAAQAVSATKVRP
jgi:hypothetical protein